MSGSEVIRRVRAPLHRVRCYSCGRAIPNDTNRNYRVLFTIEGMDAGRRLVVSSILHWAVAYGESADGDLAGRSALPLRW